MYKIEEYIVARAKERKKEPENRQRRLELPRLHAPEPGGRGELQRMWLEGRPSDRAQLGPLLVGRRALQLAHERRERLRPRRRRQRCPGCRRRNGRWRRWCCRCC